MLYNCFHILLDSTHQHFVKDVCIYIHEGYCSIVFFLCIVIVLLYKLGNNVLLSFLFSGRDYVNLTVSIFNGFSRKSKVSTAKY